MNPENHEGRQPSPWFEAAESGDVLDLTDTDSVDVADVLPASVAWVEGSSPMPSVLPRRHMRRTPARSIVLGVTGAVLGDAALVVGFVALISVIGGAR